MGEIYQNRFVPHSRGTAEGNIHLEAADILLEGLELRLLQLQGVQLVRQLRDLLVALAAAEDGERGCRRATDYPLEGKLVNPEDPQEGGRNYGPVMQKKIILCKLFVPLCLLDETVILNQTQMPGKPRESPVSPHGASASGAWAEALPLPCAACFRACSSFCSDDVSSSFSISRRLASGVRGPPGVERGCKPITAQPGLQ